MTTATTSILDTLDADQLRAATSREKELLIVAGPGAGKTRVLVARIVWLLRERKMPSHQVLALVFTRAAAAEVRNRVIAEVGADRAALLNVSTFHAWALRWLRRDGVFDGLRVGHDDELKAIFEGIYSGPQRRPEAKKVGKKTLRAHLRALASQGGMAVAEASQPTLALAEVYHRRLHQAGLIDPDAILGTFENWSPYPYHAYAHVLVDEAHDLTPLEARIVRLIDAESTLVLDPRQAIHEWRGADVGEVLRLWAGAARVELSRTYRFGPAIAWHANTIARDLGAGMIEGSPDVVSEVGELDRGALLRVTKQLAELHGPSNVAVLCRTNVGADMAAVELGCPLTACRVTREDDRELRAARALARLVVRIDDDAAYRDLWRETGQRDDELRQVETHAGRAHSLATAARLLGKVPSWHAWLVGALHAWKVGSDAPRFGACWTFLHGAPLREDLAHLDTLSCEQALEDLAERDDADAFAAVGNRVAVSTVHAAKGREWPAVVFIDFRARTEEDSRIRFVAMTRARNHLVVLQHMEEDR